MKWNTVFLNAIEPGAYNWYWVKELQSYCLRIHLEVSKGRNGLQFLHRNSIKALSLFPLIIVNFRPSSGMWLHVAFVLRLTCFAPFSFKAPYQCITLLNLCPLIFGVIIVDLLLSLTLTLIYFIVSYGNIFSDLHRFDLRPLFRNTIRA
jgi:hypothetical protein